MHSIICIELRKLVIEMRMLNVLAGVRGLGYRVILGDGYAVLYSITPREHNHNTFLPHSLHNHNTKKIYFVTKKVSICYWSI
jgi:hypothetical protein